MTSSSIATRLTLGIEDGLTDDVAASTMRLPASTIRAPRSSESAIRRSSPALQSSWSYETSYSVSFGEFTHNELRSK